MRNSKRCEWRSDSNSGGWNEGCEIFFCRCCSFLCRLWLLLFVLISHFLPYYYSETTAAAVSGEIKTYQEDHRTSPKKDCSGMFSKANIKGFMHRTTADSSTFWLQIAWNYCFQLQDVSCAGLYRARGLHLLSVFAFISDQCAAEECFWGQGPSPQTCLTSAAHSSRSDWPSPRNPTTTGSSRDSSASIMARNSLQGRPPIKSLCSLVSATSQVLISALVWGFQEKLNTPWPLSPHVVRGGKVGLERGDADLLRCSQSPDWVY